MFNIILDMHIWNILIKWRIIITLIALFFYLHIATEQITIKIRDLFHICNIKYWNVLHIIFGAKNVIRLTWKLKFNRFIFTTKCGECKLCININITSHIYRGRDKNLTFENIFGLPIIIVGWYIRIYTRIYLMRVSVNTE